MKVMAIDGVAVMINCLTDNKIRTVADIDIFLVKMVVI